MSDRNRSILSLCVVLVFVGLAFGSKGPESTAPTVTPAGQPAPAASTAGTPSAAAPTTAPATVAAIGDTVTFGDSEWVVLSAEDLGTTLPSGNQFIENATTAGKFVKVTFRVTNRLAQEERIIQLPELRDSQGRTFRHFDRAAMYLPTGQGSMMMEALPASIPKEFTEIYEVPADATGLVFLAREIKSFTPSTQAVALGF